MTAEKKKKTSERSIWNLFFLLPSIFGMVKSLVHNIKLETYFTIKNIITLMILGAVLACLVTATWLGVLGILFFGLIRLEWAWYSAAAMVFFLNVIVMLVVGMFVAKIKSRLVFSDMENR